jgi:hypothetical protein
MKFLYSRAIAIGLEYFEKDSLGVEKWPKGEGEGLFLGRRFLGRCGIREPESDTSG